MNISLHGQSVALSDAIRLHTNGCLAAALDRYERRIEGIDVRLRDINGPRGGVDKACEVVVSLRPSGLLIVKETTDDLYIAVSRAAHRLKATMARELQRLKARRK